MTARYIRHSWRFCLYAIVIASILSVIGSSELHAQHQRAAGVFLGISHPEKRVIWHGLAEETERDGGFSIGAVYEIGISEIFTLVLSPQYSEVSHSWSIQYTSKYGQSERFRELSVPPMYAIEMPLSIRAGISVGTLYPYAAIGAFVGYAFPDEATNYSDDYYSSPRVLPSIQYEDVSRIIAGAQIGAGISADILPGISIEADWMLYKHFSDPVSSPMVTWEAPLRAVWRFAVVFPLEGGAQ